MKQAMLEAEVQIALPYFCLYKAGTLNIYIKESLTHREETVL